MNKITKDDFVALMRLSEHSYFKNDYDSQAATEATQNIQNGNFSVDDREGKQNIRSKQQVFSNKGKANYGNKCAICSISTKAFFNRFAYYSLG